MGFTWRKSSFSGGDSDCVEVGWRKSSFSGQKANCVELAWPGGFVAVRDSKNPGGGHLTVPAFAFAQLRSALRPTH
nr:DUF397 domain-containing protein [Kibdelosporangium sp. MJ126-NF4]CEL21424.1 hypothetical protein [Kibdelosporangium sp. MJ126-NF4]CTQ96009.1 hypothetical protein [Kibdelosporangium sp. MJ126-NF4]